MEELPILNIIGGILLYLGKILIVVASLIAVYKKKSIGSMLLLLGAVLIIIGDLASMVLLINAGSTGPEQVVKITGVNSLIAALTYLLFAVGILVYILENVRHKTRTV